MLISLWWVPGVMKAESYCRASCCSPLIIKVPEPSITIADSSALWKWVLLDVPAWNVVIALEISVAPFSLVTLLATETPGARRRLLTSSLLMTRGSGI